jgi:hypothetical protein
MVADARARRAAADEVELTADQLTRLAAIEPPDGATRT